MFKLDQTYQDEKAAQEAHQRNVTREYLKTEEGQEKARRMKVIAATAATALVAAAVLVGGNIHEYGPPHAGNIHEYKATSSA